MSTNIIFEVVCNKIASSKKIEVKSVSPNSDIKDDLGVTSLEYVSILTDLALDFGIDLMSFTEGEIISTKTVQDLVQIISSKA